MKRASEAQLLAWVKQTSQRRDRLMAQIKLTEARLLELRDDLIRICKRKGHNYKQMPVDTDDDGAFWDCYRCGHTAPGRWFSRPSGRIE